MFLMVVLACTTGDPEQMATREAVAAFREGREALEADPEAALASFRQARDHRPFDPVLRAWEAMAVARTGDLEAAVAILDELIAADPRFAEARYNRAAWLARLGRLDEAGEELRRALALGAAREREAMTDPDFFPHLDHPAFAFLPDDMLLVAVEAPEGTAFWGSEVAVRFRVLGTGGHPVRIDAERTLGPLVLTSVREDAHQSSEGPARDLRYTFRVVGAGPIDAGPFTVHAGRWSKTVPPMRLQAEAPEGRAAPADLRFPTALALRGGWGCEATVCEEAPEEPRIRRGVHGVDVLTRPGARVEASQKAPLRADYAIEGRPIWTLTRFPPGLDGSVQVREGREVTVLEVP
jgi:tetratricopeptide (TPR) repeat protein